MAMEVDFAKMAPVPAGVETVIKRFEAAGAPKAFWHRLIQKKAEEVRKANETKEQAYTRTIISDPEGRVLFKAMQRAQGYEAKTDPSHGTQDFIGPNHVRLHVLATARQRERSITYPAAASEVVNADPALSAALREEHMSHAMSAMSGAGGIHGHTMDIGEAHALAETNPSGGGKVKPFPVSAYGASQAKKSANSAEAALEALARAYHAKHAGTSYEVAFTKVLTAPENRALAKRAQTERLAALGVA